MNFQLTTLIFWVKKVILEILARTPFEELLPVVAALVALSIAMVALNVYGPTYSLFYFGFVLQRLKLILECAKV